MFYIRHKKALRKDINETQDNTKSHMNWILKEFNEIEDKISYKGINQNKTLQCNEAGANKVLILDLKYETETENKRRYGYRDSIES